MLLTLKKPIDTGAYRSWSDFLLFAIYTSISFGLSLLFF